MVERELYKQGEAIRRQLRGDADFIRNKREYDKDPVMKKFIDVATETVFGALWARPGLDFKTRTLICVVSDAATGRHPELDIHLRLALKQGWSEDELVEVTPRSLRLRKKILQANRRPRRNAQPVEVSS